VYLCRDIPAVRLPACSVSTDWVFIGAPYAWRSDVTVDVVAEPCLPRHGRTLTSYHWELSKEVLCALFLLKIPKNSLLTLTSTKPTLAHQTESFGPASTPRQLCT
jgi:hypothetical protein